MTKYGELKAGVRQERGKGAARSLRRQGLVPAVMYGGGKDNVALSFAPLDFRHATDPKRHWNTFYTLTISEDGKPDVVQPCVVADVQVHTVRREVMHVDFLRVDPEGDVVRKVPTRFAGRPVGVATGGRLKTFRRWLRVAAKPANIPEEVEVEVSGLNIGDSVRVSDLSLEGVRIVEDPNGHLAIVEVPKATREDAEAEAAAADDSKDAEPAPEAGKDTDKDKDKT